MMRRVSISGTAKSASVESLKMRLRADSLNFLRQARAEVEVGVRNTMYMIYAVGAISIEFMEKNPKELRRLRQDEFFASMHVKPKDACHLVMQYLLSAKNEGSRHRANRAGRAVRALLDDRVSPKHIARKLSIGGDVDGVLQSDRRLEPNLKPEPTSSGSERRQTERSTTPLLVNRWKPEGLIIPKPPAGSTYLIIALPIGQLARRLKPGRHRIAYEVELTTTGWAAAEMTRDQDE